MHIVNVGQGDAIIVRCPDGEHEIVIDAAELNYATRYQNSQKEFENYIRSFQAKDNDIEVIVASHPHSDHIAGMGWLVKNFDVGLYVDNGMSATSATYKNLEKTLKAEMVKRARLTDSTLPKIDFCPREDVNAQILRPEGWDEKNIDENNYSVVVRIDYGDISYLFTGDAEKEMEDKLVADSDTKDLLDVDFLKVGHHGSYSSSQKPFLDIVTPQIAAISCGAETVGVNKSHKHPHLVSVNTLLPYLDFRNGMETTLEAYNRGKDKWEQVSTRKALYVTNNDGDLIFLSDGKTLWRKGDR